MKTILSVHWVLFAAIWMLANGVLHDLFVLKNHQGSYNRDLLRLLMDGHVLIVSGAVLFVCYLMMLSKIQCGCVIAIIVALGMLLYVAMIWPFLKSVVTGLISIMVIIVSTYVFRTFPDIWQVMEKYR